jgi:iron complex outermembrane recepter protein
MKMHKLSILLSFTCLTAPAFAQQPAPATDPAATEPEAVIVTGSRIKRAPLDSALPLQVITNEDLQREGINSAEQLTSFLTANGTGADNLASNADVVSGQARGNNGLSAANLRGQGPGATLVLLNGRRVAAHGLNGSAVDVNQIPFAAIARVEVLKDGASAIYGTDAIGGVINYITKKNFEGFNVRGFADITEQGGANNYTASGMVGYGDLSEQGFNIMAAVSYDWKKSLRGDQRDFVNTFQPDRGVSVDTRGTPFATIVPLAGTAIASAGASPLIPGTTVRASGGINVLDLPGQPGCNAIDGQAPYDEKLWAFAEAQLACAWDTGRAAVLQQPIDTLTYYTRAIGRLGDHEISVEYVGSQADSAKRFSNLQITPNTTTQRYSYARNANNTASYNQIAGALTNYFAVNPNLPVNDPYNVSARALQANLAAGQGISYRWRCIECGPREIETNVKTNRIFGQVTGPITESWDYASGVSYATSKAKSTLGSGYYFRGTVNTTGALDGGPGIIPALNTGIINPFLFPGQTQSQAALDLLKAASAEGTVLYGGKYSTLQADLSASGRLFETGGGDVQMAFGIDYREEKYRFNGDERAAADQRVIIAAPFDNANALASKSRTSRAAYAEILVPLFEGFEITGAIRHDRYKQEQVTTKTTNPKVSFKYTPVRGMMFRGSYNTGFRLPSFNQTGNPPNSAPYTGRDIADPLNCPGGRIDPSRGRACEAIQPFIVQGGNPNLGPEKAEQYSLGVVLQPIPKLVMTFDYWNIRRKDSIVFLTLQQLAENYADFKGRYLRVPEDTGPVVAIDQRIANAGESITSGIEASVQTNGDAWGGTWSAGIEGTYLLKKKERILNSLPFANQLGVFTFSGDLGLRWKHNASVSYSHSGFTGNLSQRFRSGYTNQELPGVTAGVVTPPNLDKRVDKYVTYNASLSYKGLIKGLLLTAGVKNIFNTDPPFAITYDSNTGSGSSWEPRVADPRGRSFTIAAEYKF